MSEFHFQTKKKLFVCNSHKAIMINDMCSIKLGGKNKEGNLNTNIDTFAEFVMCILHTQIR